MFDQIPTLAEDAFDWSWDKFQPFIENLNQRELNTDNLDQWMTDWSKLSKLLQEIFSRLYVATTQHTADKEIEKRYFNFLENIYPNSMAADQKLKQKLLESGLVPENFGVQIRDLKTQASLFRTENLPLLSTSQKLGSKYDNISGEQSVMWEGKEVTLPQLRPVYQDEERSKREKAWRLIMDRWLEDRDKFNNLWVEFIDLREKLAKNADHPDYRSYRFQEMLRLDYSVEECMEFDKAILDAAVPAAKRAYEKRKEHLDYNNLRPWDLDVDVLGREPLRPYKDVEELITISSQIFHKVDPALGGYFDTMREENLLDLENRKNKAPGAYCVDFQLAKRPFIFQNAVGLHEDVQTVLHETGHAFHVFESIHLPYSQQLQYGAEIAEVASTAMELLASPYLARRYMAGVDLFQHWVYENLSEARNPDNCDTKWGELWDQYMIGVNWDGFDEVKKTGWHRKLHIFQIPFYYIDYGLAQIGAIQIWENSLSNQSDAIAKYRYGLSLGATRTLPELFKATGGKLAFDLETVARATKLLTDTIEDLEKVS